MYGPDRRARLTPLRPALPDADAGAPLPVVAATEHAVLLAYHASFAIQEERDDPDAVVVVRFDGAYASMLGPPNDEAITGHPLARAGLRPLEFVEVERSPWVAALERMNRVHPQHSRAPFDALRHLVLPFHDTTFECLARDVRAEGLRSGTTAGVLADRLAADPA